MRTESDIMEMTEFRFREVSAGSACRDDKSFRMTCGICDRLFALPVGGASLSVLFGRQYTLVSVVVESGIVGLGSSEMDA
jgi:hypothetical protein